MERSLASRISSIFIAFVMVFTCCGIPTETISAWADEAAGTATPTEQEAAGTQEPAETDPAPESGGGNTGEAGSGEATPPAKEPQQPAEGEAEDGDGKEADQEESEDEEEKRDPRDISEDATCISVRPVMFKFTQDDELIERDLSTGSAVATDLDPETACDLLLQYTITLKADQCVKGDTFRIGLPEPFLSVDGARMPAGDDVIASYELQTYGIVATLGEGAESEDEIAYTLFIPVNLNADALGKDPIDLTIAGYEDATAKLTLPAAPEDKEEKDAEADTDTESDDTENEGALDQEEAIENEAGVLAAAIKDTRENLENGRTTDETTTASHQVKWLDNYDIANREAFANQMTLMATIDGVTKPVSEYLRQLGLSEAPAITASNEGTNVTTYECSGLPVESINGKSVSYSLQEPEVYDGYLKQTNSKDDTYWVKATTCTFNVVYMDGGTANHKDAKVPTPQVMRLIDASTGLQLYDIKTVGATLNVPDANGEITLSNVPLYDVEKPETNLAIVYALQAGDSPIAGDGTKYTPVYDNANVPNFGTKTDACYQGGKTILRLEGTTNFSATKRWVDECSSFTEKREKRPKATLYMWRYSEKSNDPKTAYQVYDSNHSAVRVDLDVQKDTQTLEAGGFNNLPKYDPEGYKYVYFLREKLFPVEGNDSYEQISGAIEMEEGATPSALSEEEGEGEGDNTANGGESNGAVGVVTNGIVYNGGTLSNRVTGQIEITAKKTWVAAALQSELDDVKVTLQLQKKYSDSSWEWTDKTVVLDGFCTELMTRTKKVTLPEFDEQGRAIQYRWVETKIEKDDQVIELNPDPETGASTFQLETVEGDIDSPYQFESSVDENGAVINKLVGTTSYKIIKEWKNEQGEPIPAPEGATIDVDLTRDEQPYATYRIDGDPSTTPGTSVKGETFDDEGWTLTIENLPKYDDEGHRYTYSSEEKGIKPEEEAQKWSTDYEYKFRKKGDGFDGMVVTNTYGKGSHYYIMVNKKWRDDGDEAHRYPVTIAIFNGSETEPEKTITLDESEAWWEKVEVEKNPNDPANNYYIREVKVGEYSVITTNEEDGPFDETSHVETNRNTYIVTYEPPTTVLGIPCYTVTNRRVGTVNITVNKTWVDPSATQADARPNAVLSLKCEEYPTAVTLSTESTQGSVNIPNLPENESVTLATKFKVDKVERESSYTFNNLPKYDINGKVIHYTVTEELGASPEGSDTYESELVAESYTPDGKSIDQDVQTLDFKNTVHATTQAVFHKHWNDAYQNYLGNRPDIYLDLWQKTSTDDAPVLTDYKPREWTKDSDNPAYNESCIFPDLPKYDENGEIIEYYASEHTVVVASRFDYTKVSYSSEPIVVNNRTKLLPDGGTFTNGCEKNITVSGTKQWENVPIGFIKNDLPIVTIHLEQHQRGTAEDAWTEIASVESNNSLTEWASGGYEFDFTITHKGDNTPQPQTANGQTSTREQTSSSELIPYYDENGALYEYRVKETFNNKTEEGLNIAYEADPKINAFSVSNTFISDKNKPNTYGSIMVYKYWDRPPLEKPYPATTFVLTRAYKSDTEGILVKDDYFSLSKTLSPDDAAHGGEYSRVEFTDLLRFAPNGKPYIYTVTEKTVDGYTTCVGSGTAEPSTEGNTIVANSDVLKASEDDTVSFKNSYVPGQVNVTGTKVWNDYNNAFGIRPKDIKVELHRKAPAASGYDNAIGDEVVQVEPTWTKPENSNTWTYIFENLDRYAPNGKAWQYQVVEIAKEESDPDGYYGTENQSTGWKTAGKTDNVELDQITNEFDMKASVEKQWVGDGPNNDDIYGLRPTSVTVKLQVKKEGGTWEDAAVALGTGIESSIVLSSSNSWSHTFRNLPPAREVNGNVVKLSYRVVETKLGDQELKATVNDNGSYTFEEGSVKLNYTPENNTTSSKTIIKNTMADSMILQATKQWSGDLSNAFGTRPGDGNTWTIKLTLQRSTDGQTWENVLKAGSGDVVTVTISGENEEKTGTTFKYLPRYDAEGKTYRYRVVEEDLGAYKKINTNDPIHYEYKYNDDADKGEPSFTVKLTNEMIFTNVGGTKTWYTYQKDAGIIPSEYVNLTLQWSTNGTDWSDVPIPSQCKENWITWTEGETKENDHNGLTKTWNYEFAKDVLPKYNAAREQYSYRVVETPVEGYTNPTYDDSHLKVTNTQKLGSVTFTKKDTDGNPLAGAMFKLTRVGDKDFEMLKKTNENGVITFDNLKWDNYKVTEIESPKGYWFDKSENILSFLPFVRSNNYTTTFAINAQNCKQNINLGSFENKATNIQFAKVDSETKSPVSGATLQLTGKFAVTEGETITWETGNQPHTLEQELIVNQEYTLKETERAPGYRSMPEGSYIKFKMKDNGKIEIIESNFKLDDEDLASVSENGLCLTLKNKKILGGFELTKTIDRTEGQPLEQAEKLPGVQFSLIKQGEQGSKTLTTDSEGKIKAEDLGEGSYTLTEIKTIDGAILPPSTSAITFTINESTHNIIQTFVANNESTKISILKTDGTTDSEGNPNPLPGAKLTLTGKFADTSQTTRSWTSGDTPEHFTRKLIVGQEYELSEEGRVDGYRTLPGTVKFRIRSNGAIEITQNTNYQGEGALASVSENGLTLNLANVKVRGSVELTKYIDDDSHPLKGATFDLYKKNADGSIPEKSITSQTTDGNGQIKIDGLEEGKYCFVETATVDGAILDATPIDFEIKEKDHGSVVEVGEQEKVINKSTSIGILKVNSDSAPDEGELADGDPLPGAQLTLEGQFAGKEGTTTETWNSTENAKQFIRELIVGNTYTLKETSTVDGYLLMTQPVTFSIDGQGKIVLAEEGNPEGLASVSENGLTLNLANVKVRGSVELTKYIDDDSHPLEGATFDLYKVGQNNPIRKKIKTNADGKITVDNLAKGRYCFVETATVDGAILDATPIYFEIKEEDHNSKPVKVSTTNESTEMSFAKVERDSVSKNDGSGDKNQPGNSGDGAAGSGEQGSTPESQGNGTGTPVEGANLMLSGRFAKNPDGVICWTSDSEPYTLTGELIVGNTYTLSEKNPAGDTTRVDGYLAFNDYIRFKFLGNDSIEIIHNPVFEGKKMASVDTSGGLLLMLDNVKVRGNVELTKNLAEDGPIEGVTFSLFEEDVEKPLRTDLVTGENGMIQVNDLPEGKYYFVETATVDGAILNTAPVKFEITPEKHHKTVELSMDNPKTKISIAKIDQVGDSMEDAQLVLSGNFAGTDETEIAWTSGMDPESFTGKLIVGEEYTLSEPVRISGYAALPNPVVFKLDEQGRIQISQNASFAGTELASVSEDGLTLSLANIEIRADVQLTKTLDGETPLPGAVFDLYEEGADNPLKAGLVTDNDGRIAVENLPEGSYYFQETEAPNEAVLDPSPIRFVIDESVHGTTVQVDADNKGFKSSISLKKVDSETGKAIPGVQFTLYQVKANGATVPVGSSLATNSHGYVSFTVTEKGSYRIQETQAASGYKFDANKSYTASFVIDSDDLDGKTLKLGENSAEEAAAYQLKVSNALYKDGNVANEPEKSESALKKALVGLAKTGDGLGGLLIGLGTLAAAALATLIAAARKRWKSPESPQPQGPSPDDSGNTAEATEPPATDAAKVIESEPQAGER